MKPSEVLRAARAKIEKAENWTQGEYGRDARGRVADVMVACSRCSVGAVFAVCAEVRSAPETRAWNLLREQVPGYSESWVYDPVVAFNDTSTHAEVLALFDRAIAAAEARGE